MAHIIILWLRAAALASCLLLPISGYGMETFKPVDKGVIDRNFFLIDQYVNKLQGGESWLEPTAAMYGKDYSFFDPSAGDIPCVCLKTADGSGYEWKAYAGDVYPGPFAPLIMPVGPFESVKDSPKPVDNAETVDANFATVEAQYQRRNASNLLPFPTANLRYWKWQHQTDTGDKLVICCKASDGTYYWKGPITPSDVTYTLTTNVNDATKGMVTPGGTYKSGTIKNIQATPISPASFSAWSGDATGNTNPLPVLMDKNKTITANFTGGPSGTVFIYALTVNRTTGYAYVQKLNKLNGSQVWQVQIPGMAGTRGIYTSNLCADSSGVYVVTAPEDYFNSQMNICKLNASDGSVVWSRSVNGFANQWDTSNPGDNIWSFGPPAIAVDSSGLYLHGIYIADGGLGSEFWQFDKYNLSNGSLLQSVSEAATSLDIFLLDAAGPYLTASIKNGTFVIDRDKTTLVNVRQTATDVYFIAHYYSGFTFAYDYSVGNLQKLDSTLTPVTSLPVVARDNFVADGNGFVVADMGSQVRAYSVIGTAEWSRSINVSGAYSFSYSAIASDSDSIYVISADNVYRLNRSDGNTVWQKAADTGTIYQGVAR